MFNSLDISVLLPYPDEHHCALNGFVLFWDINCTDVNTYWEKISHLLTLLGFRLNVGLAPTVQLKSSYISHKSL